MLTNSAKAIIGFIILFGLYHAAEYFVLFTYSPVIFLLIQVAFFITAALLAKWQGFTGLAAWGMDVKKGWIKHLVTGMIAGLALYGCAFAVSLLVKSEAIAMVPTLSTAVLPLLLFCFGTFFSSFSEDILTRGYLYKHAGSRMPAMWFVIVSSAVYLLNHIYRLTEGWETSTYLFLLGVLFSLPLVITKRLWLTGGMHWIGNTTFYVTHNIINTQEVNRHVPANTVLIICIAVFIPVVVLIAQRINNSTRSS